MIVLGGLPVCGALISAFVVIFLRALAGPPLTNRDLVAGAVFIAFALAVVAIAVRAFLRVRREGDQGSAGPEFLLLAKASPALIALGLGGGAWFGWNVAHSRVEADAESAQRLCETPELWKLDAAGCAAKLPACRKEAWAKPIHDHNDPDVTRLHQDLSARVERIDDLDQRKPYMRGLETLVSNFEVADFDRATVVCLARAN